jgi:hypothetical protein
MIERKGDNDDDYDFFLLRLGCLKAGVVDIKEHKWFKDNFSWDSISSRSTPVPYLPPVRALDDTSMFDKYPEAVGEENDPVLGIKEQALFENF